MANQGLLSSARVKDGQPSTAVPLLVEIGTEELPIHAIDILAESFAQTLMSGLRAAALVIPSESVFKVYCSPRRIACIVSNVAVEQAPIPQFATDGPFVNAGLDDHGQPTKALIGFAAKVGVSVDSLKTRHTDRGERFVHYTDVSRQLAKDVIPQLVTAAMSALPIPKPMRWSDHDYTFVRPAHWLVILHGDTVVDTEILGLRSGRSSRGHRFHHPQPVQVDAADSWLDALRAAKVLADPVERRARVRAEVARVAPAGAVPRLSDALLDEIANLTEWPVGIACAFERAFLAVPQEVLVTTMETNQKFVPCFAAQGSASAAGAGCAAAADAEGRLTEHFIGVANIESKDPIEIRKGYERVIRPRFADAKFFFDEDLKAPLAAQQDALKNVTYQQALGSVWDKTVRVAELARVIANRVGVDAALATRAAALSKCDLMTRMVGEFPELQGTMGRYYAGAHGENPEVAQALDEFYRPRYAGDGIASGGVGRVLAVAERIDTLAGIFAVGMKPSGNKDPFALRRAALGLARTLIEGGLSLDLKAQLKEALDLVYAAVAKVALYGNQNREAPKGFRAHARGHSSTDIPVEIELYDFILDRLRGYYADRGVPAEAFEAVRALAPADLTDFDQRLRAVVAFAGLPEARALAAANKRIGNILRQAGDVGAGDVDAALLEGGAERELADAVRAARADVAPLAAARDYVGLLTRLAQLREPIDRYFDGVMVMADDARVRANRLGLLGSVRDLFLRVADVSLLPAN